MQWTDPWSLERCLDLVEQLGLKYCRKTDGYCNGAYAVSVQPESYSWLQMVCVVKCDGRMFLMPPVAGKVRVNSWESVWPHFMHRRCT